MSEFVSILPPNATEQERAIEAATARLEAVPVPIGDLWNPDACPAELLPWLAWALSVDYWNDAWSENEKRQVLKSSFQVHARKGTIGALKTALQALGFELSVIEWFNEAPAAAPYTFKIEVQATGRAISEAVYTEIEQIVSAVKNVRSRLSQIIAVAAATGTCVAHVAAQVSDVISVNPYSITSLQSNFACLPGIAEFSIDTIQINPQEA